MCLTSDRGHSIFGFHSISGPAGKRLAAGAVGNQVFNKLVEFIRRHQHRVIVGSHNNGTIERRIQSAEFFMAHAGKVRGTFNVNILVFEDLNEEGFVINRRKFDAVIVRILNDVFDRLKFRVVIAGFGRHPKRHIVCRKS